MTAFELAPVIGKLEGLIKYGNEAERQNYLIEIHRELCNLANRPEWIRELENDLERINKPKQ